MTQALSGDAVEKYVRVAYAYRVVNTMKSNHVSVRDLKIHSIPVGACPHVYTLLIQLHCTMKKYTCPSITSFVLRVFESWIDPFQVSPDQVYAR